MHLSHAILDQIMNGCIDSFNNNPTALLYMPSQTKAVERYVNKVTVVTSKPEDTKEEIEYQDY